MVELNKKYDVIDPNILQRQASDPDSSIWVSASAGTGKTKVLTDRVLRLLLPRSDDRPGTPAHKILCLTFTKAAANEMALRIQNMLGRWAIMEEADLHASLESLLGHSATDLQYDSARRLFAENIDSAGSLRVMTTHSFCQSVLGRFPLEAGLSPYSEVLDDVRSLSLLKDAQSDVLRLLQDDEVAGSMDADAVNNLLSELEESRFLSLIMQVSSERNQLAQLLDRYGSVENFYAAICSFYKIEQGLTPNSLIERACLCPDEDNLRSVAEIMLQDKGKTAPRFGAIILQWLNAAQHDRVNLFDSYQSVFLKVDGELRIASFPTKFVKEANPNSEAILRQESERLAEFLDIEKRVRSATLTRDLLLVGSRILGRYAALKHAQGVLDFDDLVIRTLELLQNQSDWVMYKLDEGLDHILVDEAQDTNPEQWGIVRALCTEFFTGLGARDDIVRTSFTVGDVKQSIYSFQRAAPAEFKRVQYILDQKIKDSGHQNQLVALETSFRTTQSVLNIVDRVFSFEDLNKCIGGGEINHVSYRKGQAGLVELWPLFESEKKVASDPWHIPTQIIEHESASVQLAGRIAENIRNWMDRNEVLESYSRVIEPGDIMILVKSRNAFVENLMRALKQRKIPVAGSDRMVLNEQLVVQDLIAMARFCLLPEDDLALAEVLKSPFIGFDEDELFSLSYNRSAGLWNELCNFDNSRLEAFDGSSHVLAEDKRNAARMYLAELIGRVRQMGVYEYFNYLLTQVCPNDDCSGLNALRRRLGSDVLDPLQEFLNEALKFSHDSLDHMQLFIEHHNKSETQIKREMDEGGNCVRIMTVHGSKGLQSPIVILPDTILSAAAKKPGRLIWPDKTGLDFPLYSMRKEDDPKYYSDIYQKCEMLDHEEYFRLLYVAMTRAEERLYVAGHVGTKGAKDHSWYHYIKRAMESDSTCDVSDYGVLRVMNEQTARPDKKSKHTDRMQYDAEAPDWLRDQAPKEPLPPRPLVPSRPSLDESEISLSPLVSGNEKRFKRGNITHKLLQFLPDIAISSRENAAHKFVQKHAGDLSEMLRINIVEEVLKVLCDAQYAPFFAEGSLAEVPVTGLMDDGRIVSGQIDRLVVTQDTVWILDYKSNRPPPKRAQDVQAVYKKQLIAYRDSLAKIYLDRTIHCALLWTDGPKFMIMDDYL